MSYFVRQIFMNKTIWVDFQTCSWWLTKYHIKHVQGVSAWPHWCLCAVQVGHLQRSEGVCLWETSQRHGVPLFLPESGRLRCCSPCRRERSRRPRRRSVDSNTHDLIHSHTLPTALRTLHQWQSCKYISQMTYKHCSINWCKCKKNKKMCGCLIFSFSYLLVLSWSKFHL